LFNRDFESPEEDLFNRDFESPEEDLFNRDFESPEEDLFNLDFVLESGSASQHSVGVAGICQP
jgi:hypothetical protein